MRSISIKLCVIFFSVALSQTSFAERLKVHPDEQQAMDALLKRLGVDEKDVTIGTNQRQLHKYKDYFKAGTRYFHDDHTETQLSVITHESGHVARLRVSRTDLDSLQEIKEFKRSVLLEITSNKFTNLNGIQNLHMLEYIKILGNESLIDIGAIHNLPVLTKIDANTLKHLSIKGMINLPKLETFLCGSCTVDDIYPLAGFKNLKILKMGMKQKTINSLKPLRNIQELMINAGNLTDISALRSMPKLKHLEIKNSLVENLVLDDSTPNLEYIRIADSKVNKLPDFKVFKKLKFLTLTGTDISKITTIHDLPVLETLRFARNLKLKAITNIRNLPLLKELKAYKGPVEKFETGYLPSLEELTLSENNLTKLSGFENFPKLRRLILNETKVKSLKGIEKAPSLHWVQTDYEVKQDPENIKVLRQLRENRYKR